MAENTIEHSPDRVREDDAEKIHMSTVEHVQAINNELVQVNTYEDDTHVPLGWRSWLVVLITLWG